MYLLLFLKRRKVLVLKLVRNKKKVITDGLKKKKVSGLIPILSVQKKPGNNSKNLKAILTEGTHTRVMNMTDKNTTIYTI